MSYGYQLTSLQVFSSENWPDILYNATSAEALDGQAWISAVFIAGWFLFANFILLQMFIAVINEGFAITEKEKHKAQLQAFVKRTQPQAPTVNWISRINPYRYIKARPGILTVDNLPTNLALPNAQPPLPNYMRNIQNQRNDTKPAYSQQASGTFISSLKRVAVKKTPLASASLDASRTAYVEAEADEADEPHWDATRQL